ncbi:hypothetical protein [Kitasatospora sp. NPDC051914]|uniref:hypothetical protein n=1 Tax=Kitasatospora sp. NPDC051914 TaxID=3154945 RepID=UPI0034353769
MTDAQRAVLEGWVRRRTTAQALAQRSRIVLELAVRAVVAGYVADWWAAERVETPRSDGRGANYAWLWDSS